MDYFTSCRTISFTSHNTTMKKTPVTKNLFFFSESQYIDTTVVDYLRSRLWKHLQICLWKRDHFIQLVLDTSIFSIFVGLYIIVLFIYGRLGFWIENWTLKKKPHNFIEVNMGYPLMVSLRCDVFNLWINIVYKNLKKQTKILSNLDIQINSSSLHGNLLAEFSHCVSLLQKGMELM